MQQLRRGGAKLGEMFDPKVSALTAAVGGQRRRCVCCYTLQERRFCADCMKGLLCGDCGKCAQHCRCSHKPVCGSCRR